MRERNALYKYRNHEPIKSCFKVVCSVELNSSSCFQVLVHNLSVFFFAFSPRFFKIFSLRWCSKITEFGSDNCGQKRQLFLMFKICFWWCSLTLENFYIFSPHTKYRIKRSIIFNHLFLNRRTSFARNYQINFLQTPQVYPGLLQEGPFERARNINICICIYWASIPLKTDLKSINK